MKNKRGKRQDKINSNIENRVEEAKPSIQYEKTMEDRNQEKIEEKVNEKKKDEEKTTKVKNEEYNPLENPSLNEENGKKNTQEKVEEKINEEKKVEDNEIKSIENIDKQLLYEFNILKEKVSSIEKKFKDIDTDKLNQEIQKMINLISENKKLLEDFSLETEVFLRGTTADLTNTINSYVVFFKEEISKATKELLSFSFSTLEKSLKKEKNEEKNRDTKQKYKYFALLSCNMIIILFAWFIFFRR